jgi:hypothetical protein
VTVLVLWTVNKDQKGESALPFVACWQAPIFDMIFLPLSQLPFYSRAGSREITYCTEQA